MRGEGLSCLLDRFDKRVAELFVFKMRTHRLDQALPKLLAALLVDGFVTDHGKLARAWCHKNQHRVSFRGLVHSKTMKFFLCGDQWIDIQFAALNEDADLTGRFRFGVFDRIDNAIVLELAQKFFGVHSFTNWILRHHHRQFLPRR